MYDLAKLSVGVVEWLNDLDKSFSNNDVVLIESANCFVELIISESTFETEFESDFTKFFVVVVVLAVTGEIINDLVKFFDTVSELETEWKTFLEICFAVVSVI